MAGRCSWHDASDIVDLSVIIYLIIGVVTLLCIAGIALGPGEARTVILDQDELPAMGCGSLAILDHRGNSWPVAGFNPDGLS